MVVVLREYQGKGYMKKILEHPFSEAAREGIPCVLDTDTELKVTKYTKCGMKNTAKKATEIRSVSVYYGVQERLTGSDSILNTDFSVPYHRGGIFG